MAPPLPSYDTSAGPDRAALLDQRRRDRWTSLAATVVRDLLRIQHCGRRVSHRGRLQRMANRVRGARWRLEATLQHNAGLREDLGELRTQAWAGGRLRAIHDLALEDFDGTPPVGWPDALRAWGARIPVECPWSLEEIASNGEWPPEVRARVVAELGAAAAARALCREHCPDCRGRGCPSCGQGGARRDGPAGRTRSGPGR